MAERKLPGGILPSYDDLARLEEIEREKSMELTIYEPQKAFSHSYE